MGGQENPESEINPADGHRQEGISLEQARKKPLPELLASFDSTEAGLSTGEAKSRLDEYGFNEISEKKMHPILAFLGFFWGPIPWMIEAAAPGQFRSEEVLEYAALASREEDRGSLSNQDSRFCRCDRYRG